jgi:hypothetical protein
VALASNFAELTATGIVSELHRISFSPLGRLRGFRRTYKCKGKDFFVTSKFKIKKMVGVALKNNKPRSKAGFAQCLYSAD